MKRQDGSNITLNRVYGKIFWWGIPAAFFFLSSCTTERNAVHYFDHNTLVSSEYCSSRYPVDSISYRPGKEITTHDTIIQPGEVIPCPDTDRGEIPVTVHCPPSRVVYVHTRSVDTVGIRDRSEKTALDTQISILKEQQVKTQVKLQEAETGRGNWRKRALWTWGILAAFFSGFVAFKFFKPKI